MNNLIKKLKLTALFAVLLFVGVNMSSAQQNSAQNEIQPVQLTKSKVTQMVKKEMVEQFDFTNLSAVEFGHSYDSNVRFTLKTDGKVENVEAIGENSSVDAEIEIVFSQMNLKKYQDLQASSYVMPITILVE